MLEQISSLQNPKVKNAIKLHRSRGRKQQGRFIIFGEREIVRAIENGIEVVEIFSSREGGIARLRLELPAFVSKYEVTSAVMDKLQYGERGDGLVAVAARPSTDLTCFEPSDGLLVVLEQVEKPGNVGAVLRSIDAAGGGGLILAQPMTDTFHPNSIRSSTGASFSVPTASGDNQEVAHWLKQNGYLVFCAALENAGELFDRSLIDKSAIVLGNEAQGLSSFWLDSEFDRVKLPMNGVADSLNVSVTASVILYESLRQRIK